MIIQVITGTSVCGLTVQGLVWVIRHCLREPVRVRVVCLSSDSPGTALCNQALIKGNSWAQTVQGLVCVIIAAVLDQPLRPCLSP